MICARPLDIPSKVAKRSYTRTGSSELKTVTPVPNLILFVTEAKAAKTISGLEIEYSLR